MDSHIILILMYLFLFYYLLLFHYYFRHYRNSWYSSEVFELKLDDKDKFTNLSKYSSGNIGDGLITFQNWLVVYFYLLFWSKLLWTEHCLLEQQGKLCRCLFFKNWRTKLPMVTILRKNLILLETMAESSWLTKTQTQYLSIVCGFRWHDLLYKPERLQINDPHIP